MLMRYRQSRSEQQEQFLSDYNNPVYLATTTQSAPVEEVPLKTLNTSNSYHEEHY
jgi:hypothetical protein